MVTSLSQTIAGRLSTAADSVGMNTDHLPHGTKANGFIEQLGMLIERIEDEDRTIVANSHRLAVAIKRQNDIVIIKIADRNVGSKVIERSHPYRLAIGAYGIDQRTC